MTWCVFTWLAVAVVILSIWERAWQGEERSRPRWAWPVAALVCLCWPALLALGLLAVFLEWALDL